MTVDTSPPPPPDKTFGRKLMKWLDNGMNILLVLVIIMWLVQKFYEPSKPEALTQAETLKQDAEQAFKNDAPTPVVSPNGSVIVTAASLATLMETPSTQPTLLYFYASWCPYCFKMLDWLKDVAQNKQDKVRLIAVSIDEKPDDFQTYIQKHLATKPFTPYLFASAQEKSEFNSWLGKKGLQFSGAIPYIAVIHEGKPQAQINGFIAKDSFYSLIDGAAKLPANSK